MTHRNSVALALLGGLFALSAAATAQAPAEPQNPSETFTGETTVTLVEVPVQVVEDGRPVTGLGPEDFRIYDQGEPREILSVERVDLRTATAGGAPDAVEPPPAARRHFLFLFDLAFTDAAYLARAAEAARGLVAERLHPSDLVAVSSFNLREGVSSVVGFTPDHGQALRALDELRAFLDAGATEPEERRAEETADPDPLRLTVGDWQAVMADVGTASAAERSLADETLDWIPESSSGRRGDLLRETLQEMAEFAEEDMRQKRAAEASALVASLGALAESVRWVEGNKHLVLFSRGFESGIYAEEGGSWLLRELRDSVDRFRKAGWSIHAVETTGDLLTGNRRQRREALFFLADQTGGSLIDNDTDLSRAMGRVLEQTSVTYVLSFQTPELPMDGSFRRLEVELAGERRGARVFHREGYFVPRPFGELSPEERRALTAELVLAGQEVEEIGCRVLVSPAELGDGGAARVPVVLDVDSLSLLAGRNWQATRLEALAYAFDGAGEIAGSWGARFFVTPELVKHAEDAGSLIFYGELELPPGDYEVRALVRNVDDGRVTLETRRLRVPDASALPDGGPALFEPVFADVVDGDGREGATPILVRDVAGGESYPFTFGEERFLPRVAPALTPGTEILVVGRGLWTEDPEGLRALVFDQDGFPVPGLRVRLLGTDATGSVRQLALAFRATDLEPGDYELRLVARGASGEAVTSPPAPFRVVDPPFATR